MNKALKSATPRARGRSDGKGENKTKFAVRLYDTTNYPAAQALSSLVDLAQYEFDVEMEQARRFQALADRHRRRAFRAFDLLREYQQLIPPTGGAAQ